MKTKISFFLLTILFLLIGVACTNQTYVPTLQADLTLVGDEFHLTWNSDMTINIINIGKKNINKEGYAIVIVDNDKTFELKNKNGFPLELKSGSHNVVLELVKNDGTSYGVRKEFENVGIK